jgi:hypothetical protein
MDQPVHRGPIGEKELLQWASEISGMPIHRRHEMKDGVAYLKIFSKIWPKVVDARKIKPRVTILKLDLMLCRQLTQEK